MYKHCTLEEEDSAYQRSKRWRRKSQGWRWQQKDEEKQKIEEEIHLLEQEGRQSPESGDPQGPQQ